MSIPVNAPSPPTNAFPPVTLIYNNKQPPLALLALTSLVSVPASASPSPLTLQPSTSTAPPVLSFTAPPTLLTGGPFLLRYFARVLSASPHLSSAPSVTQSLLPADPLLAVQVDWLLALTPQLAVKDTLSKYAGELDAHLKFRTWLVGPSLTLADLAVFDALQSNQRWQAFSKPGATGAGHQHISGFPSLQRWYLHLLSLPFMSHARTVKSTTDSELAKQRLIHSQTGSFDVDLGDTSHVVTRFPPEPSGYLHIGHAKAVLLNDTIAKKFHGRMILRFDDTNPSKEKEEYVSSILQDLHTLGVQWERLTHTSDYFDLILDYGRQMLRDSKAYVDDTPVDLMRKQRMDGVESAGRTRSADENLRLFAEMERGSEEGVKCCVRAKIDMKAGNKAMRDPTIFRCNAQPHHRTGSKYKVYPTYDFACPIVDSIEGVTHALRTNEYRDRNEQYYWMIAALGLRAPLIRDYSRLNFVYTTLSKRKLTWFVNEGKVSGWADPRMPTVQGILRRGMTVEALREFMLLQGFSMGTNLMEWDKIWTINKKVIDPIARRYTAVAADRAVACELTGLVDGGGVELMTVDAHPKNKERGVKVVSKSGQLLIEHEDAITLRESEEITLMQLGNAIVEHIVQAPAAADGSPAIASITMRFHPAGDVKKTDKKLTWIDHHPTAQPDSVAVRLVELDALISVAKVEDDMQLERIVREQSWFETELVGEMALRGVRKGEHVQLNRRGYCICDEEAGGGKDGKGAMVLLVVPDGKTKNASVLGSKVDKSKMAGGLKKNTAA